jgi:hypothetical protein
MAFQPPGPRARQTAVSALLAVVAALALMTIQASSANAADRYRYDIVNSYSGLMADVMWASTSPYQEVFLWPNNSSLSQEFDLLDSGGGYFRMRARHSGQCLMLDWRSGWYSNGTHVIQYPYCSSGYAPAEWRQQVLSGTRCSGGICTTGVDQYLLVNRQTGRCLDANNPYGGRPPAQAVLQQWDCVTSTSAWNIGNQAWDLLPHDAHRID